MGSKLGSKLGWASLGLLELVNAKGPAQRGLGCYGALFSVLVLARPPNSWILALLLS